MKKKILFTAFIVISICLFIFGIVSVSAEKNYGDFTYTLSNEEVTITNCNKSITTVEIPTTIEGYPVTSIGSYAFGWCEELTEIYIPSSIKEIGYSAFWLCSNLERVTISDSVTTISGEAFAHCTSLTSITIPNNVTRIGSYAFYNCSALTSVTIGSGAESIGESAFESCTSLTSITIPDNVISIGGYAFKNCSALQNVTIGNGAESIGESAFESCTGLTSITIPDNVTSISSYAFKNCSALQNVIIGNGVENIGDYAFENCTGITDIIIGDNVTNIGSYAFCGCAGLTSITVPPNVTSIGSYAFFNCTGLASVKTTDIGGWCEIVFADYYSNPLSYAKKLYLNNELVKNLEIPDSVTSISDSAFRECSSLESVIIGDNVTSIGNSAFNKCYGIKNVTIGDNVTSIGRYAFFMASLNTVTIGKNVTSIGDSAFEYCLNISEVYYNGSKKDWEAIEIGINNEGLTDATFYFSIETPKTPAEILFELINAQSKDSCEVDIESQTVSLLKDVQLLETIEVPTGGEIILDIDEFNILSATDSDALYISDEASLKIVGTGIIKGGNTIDEQYNYVGSAILNDGLLYICGPTLIGGDERETYCYAAPGVSGWGTTYFIEGYIQAGEGNYSNSVYFTKGDYAIALESDDGVNYTVVKKEWGSNKRYIKAVVIPQNLSAAETLSAVINIIQPETCGVVGSLVTLYKDFSCPYSIEIPGGDIIVLDFNGHTVTTDDFFIPFIIPEQAEITFKGNGLLTNKEKNSGIASGGMGSGAGLVHNEGKLTIDGITVVGVDINGIVNDGKLAVNSGKITVCDSATGKDAIYNTGTITINGGEIIGGNATQDGKSGGDGIAGIASGVSVDEIYPIKLNGGALRGGKGCGDGENGRAISKRFNIGDNSIAYMSDDDVKYSKLADTICYMRYLKIEEKPTVPSIVVKNVVVVEGEIDFDLFLFSNGEIVGTIYVAIYEGERLSRIKTYEATEEIPVLIDYSKGEKIKIFWWGKNLSPIALSVEVQIK